MNDNIRVHDIECDDDDDVNVYNVHVIINDGEDNDEIKDTVNEVIWKSKYGSVGFVDDIIIFDVNVKMMMMWLKRSHTM